MAVATAVRHGHPSKAKTAMLHLRRAADGHGQEFVDHLFSFHLVHILLFFPFSPLFQI
jgi:hypothetical protein